jgi:GntR family transcriptional regulator
LSAIFRGAGGESGEKSGEKWPLKKSLTSHKCQCRVYDQLSIQLEVWLTPLAIDRASVVPLYFQIRENLLAEIRSGHLKPGDPLLSEHQLSVQLGVSRMTARQALQSLCSLGVAYRQQGKGTFVSGIKLEINFRNVQSFTEQMSALGFSVNSKVLALGVVPAPPEIAVALRVAPHSEIVRLQRLRMAATLPMAIELSHLPHHLCPGLVEHMSREGSLYETLGNRYGIRIQVADETVEVGLAGAEDARLLRVRKGSPLFVFTRLSYLADGQPVEYVKSQYRADRYKIVNRLIRPGV